VYVKGPAQFVMKGGEISGHSVTGVGVDWDGTFEMSGGKISGNTNTTDSYDRNGGGVRLGHHSSEESIKAAFTMTGGEITKNTAKYSADDSGSMTNGGGGVWMSSCLTDTQQGPTFTMSGTAVISNNEGGGVRVGAYTTFTMDGGTISGNTNGVYGGGVQAGGPFIMKGGTIHNNKADFGGGVAGELTMNGGTIKDNTAAKGGGGVWSKGFDMTKGTVSGNKAPTGGGVLLYYDGTALAFTKTVGIIYGKGGAGGDANAASTGDTYGHALYYQAGSAAVEDPTLKTGNRYYDVTAGAGVTITVTKNPSTNTFVGWDTDTGIGEVTVAP
jgi:hypothetical protein